MFTSSVLSVMSVSGFPLIIMSAHAQCSMCTCSVEGIPSLVCLHMLSVGASLISMQCKHSRKRRIFGEDEEKVKNPSSSPEICHLRQKKGHLRHKIRRLDWLNTNTNWQRWPSHEENRIVYESLYRSGQKCMLNCSWIKSKNTRKIGQKIDSRS